MVAGLAFRQNSSVSLAARDRREEAEDVNEFEMLLTIAFTRKRAI
jgi:hypothetical protein